MFTPNPVNETMWDPTTSALSAAPSSSTTPGPLTNIVSNPEDVKKRKRTSLLSGLANKFSRKKSNPTNRISKEEIWKATGQTIHPNAKRLGMNTFNFNTGGSTNGRVEERELSPAAVSRRKESRDLSPGAIDDHAGANQASCRRRSSNADTEGDGDDDRGRNRSGFSAYSDAARKRASGYVARLSTSSSSWREPSYGEAQIATFTAAYPRQIDTRIDSSPAFDPNASISTIYSPVSSTGSSMQRSGSSIFDRSRSRFDSMATDVTTPDTSDCYSKSRLLGKTSVGVLPSLWSGDELSSSIPEEEREPDQISLPASEDDGASIGTTEETHSITPEEEPVTALHIKKLEAKADLPCAPFVASDLQAHQVRVQDFTLGTHVVQNAMDMAINAVSQFPRKHRKSVFLEMSDDISESPPAWLEEALEADDEVSVEVEQTLRGLSISAVDGSASRNDSNTVPSPTLDTVAEEDDGPWIFGHKRSVDHTDPSELFNGVPLNPRGELPLHERAGDGLSENVKFRPGHRRSRAVSLGRPKTIIGVPEMPETMPGS